MDRLLDQLERLQQQNAEMALQMAHLREENAALRRQFLPAPMTHQPYAASTGTLLSAAHSSTRPRSPGLPLGTTHDVHMIPSEDLDTKRARLQPGTLNTGIVPGSGVTQGHGL